MSTNELNIFLNSFDRPQHFSDVAWDHLLKQSHQIWQYYLAGQHWSEAVEIPCKEAYLMLVNKEGKLIVTNESLLHYVRNEHTVSWRRHLEDLAFRAIAEKRLPAAERFFTKALKVDDHHAMNYYRRALVRIKMMRHKEALNDLCAALQLNPDADAFLIKRAEVYRLLDVDHKAMTDLNRAVRINPKNAKALEMRGKFRLSLGDRAGARLDLLKAEELEARGLTGGGALYGSQAA